MSTKLTQARLKEVLHYGPETGLFTWLSTVIPPVYAGKISGYIDDYGYRVLNLDGNRRSQHRLAYLYMTGDYPVNQIDHVNGDRSDNRWCNLRPATDSQNRQNMKKKAGTKSRFQGVTWFPRDGTWMSRIGINYKSVFLGYFKTEEEAHQAYVSAKTQHHTFQPTPRMH